MNTKLVLIMSHDCNSRCSYCPVIKRKNQHMSFDIAKKSIDLYIGLKLDKYVIKFFGGEPLLNKDVLFRVISYIRENYGFKKIYIILASNGLLLNKDLIKFFLNNRVIIRISLDGTPSTQIKERGYSSSTVIDKIPREYRRLISVYSVVSPTSVRDLYDNFLYLYNKGFRVFKVEPAYLTEWSYTNLKILYLSLKKIVSFVKAINSRNDYSTLIKFKNKEGAKLFTDYGYIVNYDGYLYAFDAFLFDNILRKKHLCNVISVDKFPDVLLMESKIVDELEKYFATNYDSKINLIHNMLSLIFSKFGKALGNENEEFVEDFLAYKRYHANHKTF